MEASQHELLQLIESALEAHIPQTGMVSAKRLDDALHHALFSGGKRLRPMLSILGARIFCKDVRPALPAACAVEFIHCTSLILDDLPCMDDAEIRRGVPVLHRVYGEDVALLVAVALLNESYAIFGRTPALIAEATRCIGVQGMIGGQALDLLPQHAYPTDPRERQKKLAERNKKTSAMMRLAFIAGALACETPPEELEPLGAAGHSLGEAYQIGDDLLDVRRSSAETGKTAGQDGRHQRPNHVLHDEHSCLDQVSRLIEQARETLRAAYGPARVAELLRAVDAIFASLMAEGSSVS
jgi:geranylgeranyl pyrophosphate synthase